MHVRLQGQQAQQRKAPQQHQLQAQSKRRVVTVSHDTHVSTHAPASQPRYVGQGTQASELMMPPHMPPMPMQMHPGGPTQEQAMFPPLQDPPQGPPFAQERQEDPSFLLPQEEPPREWLHQPEPMDMSSLPQPWHVHERQMSGHMGHPMEMQAEQRFGMPEGHMPNPGEAHQPGMQHMHLPPHLPPMPMPMPPGEPMYNHNQGQFGQPCYGDQGMGHPEQFNMGPPLRPPFGGPPDFGRQHPQGYGMYGPQEQLPFPPQ